MDFYLIKQRSLKNGLIELYPDFKICRSKDLMIRGRSFYAIWDEEKNIWSTDEYDVQRLVDDDLRRVYSELKEKTDYPVYVKYMSDFSTNTWSMFKKYISSVSDSNHTLDNRITFYEDKIVREDYVSKRLPYSMNKEIPVAYHELSTTLYDPEELEKIEWAIGSVISGDSKDIQKFIVLYGEGGTGKSTMLNIIQKIFQGYYTMFDAKELTSNSNAFSTEAFRGNPLVAIQHDGDLSRIEDNTKINSIVSHEEMIMNEKYKSNYTSRINAFLFMGTNKPVRISDAKSGVIRRLIDVKPSGRLVPSYKYDELFSRIDFELGSIANHCLEVYKKLGKNYYAKYRPIDMIFQTDVFYNFVEMNYETFKEEDGVTLMRAYDMYKRYCDESLVDFKLPRHKFREELKNYFRSFTDRGRINGSLVRSYYSGFISERFESLKTIVENEVPGWLDMTESESKLDVFLKDCIAQYASENGTPEKKWVNVNTVLSDIDTHRLHYILFRDDKTNVVCVDFDIKDEDGNKSLKKNIEAASKFPPTYAEVSKSGSGIHLHYIYNGDVDKLSRMYSDGIEIKIFNGNSSLRRKLTKCNDLELSVISDGLPVKGEKMLNQKNVENEQHLRSLIFKNLKKEIHPATKPSIDFIFKLLDDSYSNGIIFDVTDLRPKILTFAARSTNNADYCIKQVSKMHFKSEDISANSEKYSSDQRLVFFDVEVFPNLFIICWKFRGDSCTVNSMINPKPPELEEFFKLKLIGFNNRRYDNHICYAAYLGYNNEELFKLSQRIIGKSSNAMFGEAYNISYTDIYDFSASIRKKSLKKWEIELGIHHLENELPWDQPVPNDRIMDVVRYCSNDVMATEKVFDHLKGDWAARQILADLSGLTVNDTTNSHTTKIVFGNDRNPQSEFNYPDLSVEFPGYRFENGISWYKGYKVSEGGEVLAIPGMHGNVCLLDVESMHPHTIKALNLFGKYTQNFIDLMDARLLIKHKDVDKASKIMGGKLAKYLEDPKLLPSLKDALKTAINSVYGLTFTAFSNPFRDPRNVDNVVAKRGALFMIDLKEAVEAKGYTVCHIKTDSIKIPDADISVINFVHEFGKKYGYSFEHEATYDKMCLVNNAVYIAKYDMPERCRQRYGYVPKENENNGGKWTATGAQFAHPYVFKTLFSKESVVFEDMCEVKSVSTAMYLDFNESLEEGAHNYKFIGKVGSFCPIASGHGGGELVRCKQNSTDISSLSFSAVGGTKGFRWLDSLTVKAMSRWNDVVDYNYFRILVDQAVEDISKFGNFEMLVSEDFYEPDMFNVPSCYPCGEIYESCQDCPYYYMSDSPKFSKRPGFCDKDSWACDAKRGVVSECINCEEFDGNKCSLCSEFNKFHEIERLPF